MENDKTLRPVEGGQIRKKSEFSKIIEAFTPENKADVSGSILRDIIVPELKKIAYNIVDSATSMILWGEGGPRSSNYISSGNNGRINYQRISTDGYSPRFSQQLQEQAPRSSTLNQYAWFPDRGRADSALMDLQAAAERSKCITVADLYSVAGIESDNYQIHKYGWSSDEFLSTSKVAKSLDGGWYIKLPKPYQI